MMAAVSEVTSDATWRARAWGAVAGLLTVGVQLLQVRWWSPRIPMGDEWQTLTIVGPAARTGVRVGMLWDQHNEHRIVIANAVFLVTRRLGGWVVLAPHIVSALMMGVTICVLVSTLLRLGVRPGLVAIAGSFALTPLQWENTVWGFQVQFVALVAGTVVTLCVLAGRAVLDRRAVVVAVLGGLWCTGTIASGILTWGVLSLVLGVLVLVGRSAWTHRAAWVRVGGVLGVGVVLFGVYRIGYVTPGRLGGGGIGHQLRWTLRALVTPFAGTGAGAAVDDQLPLGVALGAIVGALMIATLAAGTVAAGRRGDAGRVVLLVGLAAWAVAQAVLIGAARAAGGEVNSRYVSLFVWLTVAGVVAADSLLPERVVSGGRVALTAAVAAVLGLAVVQHLGAVRGVPEAARQWAARGTLDTTVAFLERAAPATSPPPTRTRTSVPSRSCCARPRPGTGSDSFPTRCSPGSAGGPRPAARHGPGAAPTRGWACRRATGRRGAAATPTPGCCCPSRSVSVTR